MITSLINFRLLVILSVISLYFNCTYISKSKFVCVLLLYFALKPHSQPHWKNENTDRITYTRIVV